MKNILAGLRKFVSSESELDEIASLDSKPSFSNETIRELNGRLHGLDIRNLWKDGYSDKQIRRLLMGEYNFTELYKMNPEGNNRTP